MIPLTIWHIGGDGAIGPAEAITKKVPHATLVTFDVRQEVGLPVCFSDKEGEADFYITQNKMASSLLRATSQDEQVLWDDDNGRRVEKWGDLTAVTATERVRTTTIDAYAAEHGNPDVLSLDVQGAETMVLRGAEKTLPKVLAVITEVEFWPVYEGQGLIDEQMAILRRHGFRLLALYNSQEWHKGEPSGRGFLTVAEAVWLRDTDGRGLSFDQLANLTQIAATYDAASYALKLLGLAQNRINECGPR